MADVEASVQPIQVSFAQPNAPSIRMNIHLTIRSASILLFLTTTAADAPATACPLGSFVYAIPSRSPASEPPLTTTLYNQTATLDTATRMASLVAKRTGKPTYVGNSVSFAGAGRGGDADEEIAGFRRAVEVVMEEIEKSTSPKIVNGT